MHSKDLIYIGNKQWKIIGIEIFEQIINLWGTFKQSFIEVSTFRGIKTIKGIFNHGVRISIVTEGKFLKETSLVAKR